MRPSPPQRVLVGVVLLGTLAALGCRPRVVPSPLDGMSRTQEATAIALTSWVGCATVDRVSTTPGQTTPVEICADTGAKSYGPNAPPSGLGRPVARLRNLGSLVERKWNLQPHGLYLLWLNESPAGGALWTMRGPGVELVGRYEGCGYHAATVSRANFGSCAENPVARQRAMGALSRGPSTGEPGDKDEHILLDRASGPAWISCTEGCCMADAAML